MVQPLWKTVWQFLSKLKMGLPYAPEITLLGIYPREMKNYFHTGTCTQMFTEASFVTVKRYLATPRNLPRRNENICPHNTFIATLFLIAQTRSNPNGHQQVNG